MTDEPFAWPESWNWPDRPPLLPVTAFAGHVVVVLFWRHDCVLSRAALLEAALAVAGRGDDEAAAIVAVHVGRAHGAHRHGIRRALEELPVPVTVACVAADDIGVVGQLPTLALVDARGAERARAVGVPRRRRLRDAVTMLLREARDNGNGALLPFVPVRAAAPTDAVDAGRAAVAPRAICADGEFVWVACARRRQVLRLSRDGACDLVVGTGAWGQDDGSAEVATFGLPVALCVHEHRILVSDLHGHTLRAIDRDSGEVETVCGTGRVGDDAVGGSYGRDQALAAPLGLCSHDGGVYLCHAGTDQIWQLDPMTGAAMAWLGGLADGGDEATFARPAAIAATDYELWVTELGSGTLARVDLAHVVRSTAATGFERPVAVQPVGTRVLVADEGAGAVLRFDPERGSSEPWLGAADGLVAPSGLCLDGDRVLVADPGAGCVFVVPVDDSGERSGEVRRLDLRRLPEAPAAPDGAAVAEALVVREFCDVELRIPVAGWSQVRDGQHASIGIADEAEPTLAAERDTVAEVDGGAVTLLVPVAERCERGAWRLRVRVADHDVRVVVPVAVAGDGAMQVELRLTEGSGSV